MSLANTNTYGFFDEVTQQFYVLPATNEEEFLNFMNMLGMGNNQPQQPQETF